MSRSCVGVAEGGEESLSRRLSVSRCPTLCVSQWDPLPLEGNQKGSDSGIAELDRLHTDDDGGKIDVTADVVVPGKKVESRKKGADRKRDQLRNAGFALKK